jgi:hypothetical protein
MVQPSFQTPLMAAVGAVALLETRSGTASGAAIALPAITMLTDPEHGMTSAAAANPLTENRFAMNRHARHGRELDHGNGSWQVRTSFDTW